MAFQRSLATREEAEAYAKEQDKKKNSAENFNEAISISHGDGTICFFAYAEAEIWRGWVIIYTEHTGFHLFYQRDLLDPVDFPFHRFFMFRESK